MDFLLPTLSFFWNTTTDPPLFAEPEAPFIIMAILPLLLMTHKAVGTTTKPQQEEASLLYHEAAAQKARKSLRRVSFHEERNVVHANRQWDFDDVQEYCWYNATELNVIKNHCCALAKQIHQREKEYAAIPESYQNVLLRVYDACCASTRTVAPAVTTRDAALLQLIATKATSRTGLEKVCIREITYDKRFRKQELYEMVLGIQQASARMKSDHSQENHADHARNELIRFASVTVSRAQRRFAYIMAVALANSLDQE